MDFSIASTLLYVAGMILGAIITAYSDEIKALVTGRSGRYSDLEGRWDCDWYFNTENDSKERDEPFSDTVMIESVSADDSIEGTGRSTEIGDYELRGEITSSNCVTFTFRGIRQSRLTGVVILRVNVPMNRMEGYWNQLSPEGEFVGGRTVWEKKS